MEIKIISWLSAAELHTFRVDKKDQDTWTNYDIELIFYIFHAKVK